MYSINGLAIKKNEHKNLAENTTVFTGKIFNFPEIKEELEKEYHVQFSTQSDTEILLKSYHIWGEKMLTKLDGIFAFSIFDKAKNELFIARDRLGEKGLYYTLEDNSFAWGSTLKTVTELQPKKRGISREALNIYLSLSYIPAPYTIYNEVKKLPAGHFMRVNVETLQSSIVRYWDIPTGITSGKTYTQAQQELRELLFNSVKKRMTGDAPFGAFLSGGVDSSIISAIAAKISQQPVKTFSVGYENKRYDESERARMVAGHIGSEHHEYILNPEEILNDIDRVILNYDEPYADASAIPTFFISKKASEKVEMVLSGDGGDEVFGGYNKYLSIHYRKKFNRYLPGFVRNWLTSESFGKRFLSKGDTRSFSAKLKKLLKAVDPNVVDSHLNIISLGFNRTELSQLLNEPLLPANELLLKNIDKKTLSQLTDELKLVRYLDKEVSLEGDMLVKTDRACSLAGIACRAPLLDYRLSEFSYSLPDEYLLQKTNKKRILKDTFADLLPKDFFNAPKLGFEMPIGEWFRTGLRSNLQETLSVENLNRHNLFNAAFVQQMVNEHLSGKTDYTSKLWVLFCFQKWYNNVEKNLTKE